MESLRCAVCGSTGERDGFCEFCPSFHPNAETAEKTRSITARLPNERIIAEAERIANGPRDLERGMFHPAGFVVFAFADGSETIIG